MKKGNKNQNRKIPEKQLIPINPTLQDYIDYLNRNQHLLQKEKNEYTAEGLMMLLDNEKLAALEEEFGEHQNGIELPNFIWLMKCAIDPESEKTYELVNGLIKLFQDIDINGDKHMEWSEFTQYIIDAVIGEKEAKFFDARFEKDRELTEAEILDRAYSRKTKRYVQCQFNDNNTHSNIIKKLTYSPHVDYLLCLEQSSNRLKFYSSFDIQEPFIQNKRFQLQIPLEDAERAFIIDFAIAEQLNQIAVITSNRQVYFWENNLTTRVQKSFKMDVLLTGIWYLPVHKVWITAGGDYNIRTWNFSQAEDKKKIEPSLLLIAHMKQITDICELHSPRLVASCSLDGKIKLWDITDPSNPVNKTELKDQNNDNKRGILGMDYNSYYGSNLLTYGFDTHINIWCPQVSITRAFIGKLEGHSSLVVKCKFIPQSPNVISIDDKGNIRIWDIRTMGTIQVITSDSNYSLVSDVALITGKLDRFVIAGKRCQFFENAAVTKSMKSINDDLAVLQVEFNTYFNYFVLLTKIDVRCYDAMTGKLRKVFNEVHEDKFSVDLCYFCFGGGDRKFYLADNAGLIRQYNMKNGEFLKNVNSLNEIEKSEFSKKQSHIKKKENNEISKIIYNHEEKLLIATYQDSTIRIYDEADAEESVLLKVLSGAHREAEISQITYSQKMNLMASGSSNGIIAIWNFETGKCDNLLLSDQSSLYSEEAHNGFEITALQFADPYPVLVSGTFNGYIYVWGIGPKALQYKYKCILKINNSYWLKGDRLPNQQITSLTIEASDQLPVQHQKGFDDQYAPPSSFSNPVILPNDQKGLKKGKTQQQKDQQQQLQQQESSIKQEDIQIMKGEKENRYVFDQYWRKYESDKEIKKRLYVYVGDVKGMIHCIHLTDILSNRDIQPLFTMDKKKQSFQLRRKDLINASKVVENLLSSPERLNDDQMLEVHAINSVLVKRWKSHKEKVTSMTRLNEPVCYITCSADKTVKIWSMDGEQYCQINIVKLNDNKENFWDFPYNWVEQKLKDIDHVFDSLNIITNETLTEDQKEEIKKKNLYNKYFNEEIYDNMIADLRRAKQKPEEREEEEKEKEKKQVPQYSRIKPVDPKEVILSKIQELDEILEDLEKKKVQFNFTMDNRHPSVDILNLYTIKGTGNSPRCLRAASMVYSMEASKRYHFQFRVRRLQGTIGVGICKKVVLEDYDYDFCNCDSGIGRGMYIITSDSKAYSHHSSQHDNVDTKFSFVQGDIITCKLYPYSRELIFQVEGSSYQYRHEIQYNENSITEPYSLVVLVSNSHDEIEFYGGEVISKKNKINMAYKNMLDNEKENNKIKQRVGLVQRPSNSFYGKLPRDIATKIDQSSRPATEGLPGIQKDNFMGQKNQQEKKKGGKKGSHLKLISSSQKRLDNFSKTLGKPLSAQVQQKPMTSSSQQGQEQRLSKSRLGDQRNKIFSMSSQNLVRNHEKINNIIKEFDQRPNTKDKYRFQKDIKYKLGEGKRQVRVASNQYSYKVASDSPQVLFGDNEILTRKYKFYKEIASNKKTDQHMDNEDFDDDDDYGEYKNQQDQLGKKVPQIVATRNFWNNPVRNQHKIFKTGQKIYVIEQD